MIDVCTLLTLMSSTSSRTGTGVVVAVCSDAGRIRPSKSVLALTAITSYVVAAPVNAELPPMMTRLEFLEYDMTQKLRVEALMFAGIGILSFCIRTGGPAGAPKTVTDAWTPDTDTVFPRTANDWLFPCQAIVRGRPMPDGVMFAR